MNPKLVPGFNNLYLSENEISPSILSEINIFLFKIFAVIFANSATGNLLVLT